eukprot:GHVU01121555.1.p1 GENE.GHVU01121555.1~~GHVU01121555.1.p1  ORF type:complete len:177 (+),score=14.44 GHVU01121555.1:474-1004(+)
MGAGESFDPANESRSDEYATRMKGPTACPHDRASDCVSSTSTPLAVCDACPYCEDVCGNDTCLKCRLVSRTQALRDRDLNTAGTWKKRWMTPCQLRRYSCRDRCFISAHGYVYDVTSVLAWHPAGADSILRKAGTDCTLDYDFHRGGDRSKHWDPLIVARIKKCRREDDSFSCKLM